MKAKIKAKNDPEPSGRVLYSGLWSLLPLSHGTINLLLMLFGKYTKLIPFELQLGSTLIEFL